MLLVMDALLIENNGQTIIQKKLGSCRGKNQREVECEVCGCKVTTCIRELKSIGIELKTDGVGEI